MTIYFSNILDEMKKEGIVPGLLLRCLTSVVWHSDDIVRFCSKVPGTHLFMALPLFQDPTLLGKVKELVTVEKTEGICTTPTGIPPHAQMFKSLEEIMSKIDIMDNNFQTIINDRQQLLEDYTTKINDLLERRALENNQLTHQNVKELLGEAMSDIKKDMKEHILVGEIRNEIKEALQRFNITNNDTGNKLSSRTLLPSPSANQESLTINIYSYGSGQKYYFTPYKIMAYHQSASYNWP